MQCDKCQGLVINDYGDVRCMNCGRRPITDPIPIIEQRKEEPVPRFKSEETKQNWLAAMARRRKEKGGERKAEAKMASLPAVAKSDGNQSTRDMVIDVPASATRDVAAVLSALDAAITSAHEWMSQR